MTKLDKAIHKTIYECLKIKPKESLLILIDEFAREIGQRFFQAALQSKAEVVLLEIQPLTDRKPEPSAAILKILKQAPAILAITSCKIIHSKMIRQVCHNGSRILCLNNLSDETIARVINTDYKFIEAKSHRIVDLFSIGRQIHLTTPAGTDVTFKIGRHKGTANMGIASESGSFSFFPAGEAYITPDRNSAQGLIVIDGSIPPFGLIKNPIELQVKKGYGYKLTGCEEAEKLRKILKPFGRLSRNIAEFGIGTNPNAVLTGESIEDEKVLGTAHIALGHHAFEGGSLKGNIHLDAILKKPTVTVDGYSILKNGKLMV